LSCLRTYTQALSVRSGKKIYCLLVVNSAIFASG
jgi:hypothetical protein